LVLAFSVYEHLRRPWLVTNEIAKILKPGGWLFIQTHQSFRLHSFPDDYFRFSSDALRVLCDDAGLIILDLGHSFPARIDSDRIPGLEQGAAFLNSWILAEHGIAHEQASGGKRPRTQPAKRIDEANDLSIAAIIPLYNGERWIEQALHSVLQQTRAPDEIIVVDDGSTDRGSEIVREIAHSYPIALLEKPNGGQSSARNLGVANSKSTLIAFLDQDDVWYPGHLEYLERAYRQHRGPKLGWTYSNIDQIDEQGRMVYKKFLTTLGAPHPKLDLFTCLDRDMFVLPSASLISRQAFEEVGGFDERLSGYEDDDLFLRMFRAGYVNIYLNTPLSQWRLYTGSSSYTFRMARSRMVYAAKLIAAYPDQVDMDRYFARDVIAPRFLPDVLADFNKGLKLHDRAKHEHAVADLKFLITHLRLRQRLSWRLVLPFLSCYSVARGLRQVARSVSVLRAVCRLARRPVHSAWGGIFQIR
jgi:glycosyltransferase involved in cell wall biosynthesis